MTIEEIDKAGYRVQMMTRSQIPGAGYYDAVRLEKNGKLYIAWKPQGHMEYTTPFFLTDMRPTTATIKEIQT